ncbi:MAG TPA: LysR family transcriptional regulator [Pseudolabrys sp.]
MIDKLEFLLALAREKHFGRAAETCGVTQPTLSAGVKQIEDTFGVLLVNRGSRFQGFTPEGERVLDWARRIVGDARAMREEVHALKHGLVGRLRLAAIPTALAMVETLTTPYRARHPDVQFTVYSRTSIEILAHLENLEIDAGLTYLDNEPLGRVTAVPLYRERYRLLVAADAPLGNRDTVTWAEVAKVPLCLLTPDMQNRRIIERLLRDTGVEPNITLESDSMILLYSHVRTGRWASVMPSRLAATLGLTDVLRSIPIIGPAESAHTIGLVAPAREPMTPLTAALVAEARRVAASLDD